MHILGHDGNTLSVDGAKIGVCEISLGIVGMSTLEQGDKVSLNGFLESTDGRRLESEIGLEVLGNFPDETLEGELADQKLSRFLVTTDFTEGNGTGAVTMGLLDTSGSVLLVCEIAKRRTWVQIFSLPWTRVVCGGLCLRWTCGRFV